MRFITTIVLAFYSVVFFGQLESHKFTFGENQDADKINYEMLDELTTQMFEQNTFYYSEENLSKYINIDPSLIPNYSDEELHKRLLAIPTTIPLKFTPQVGELIRYFAFKRREFMTRMLTLSQVYFPIFEESLIDADMPLELKCLSIVESALNPLAKSRVGATGLWQFMYGTAKYEGMEINTLYDSRCDIYVSTDYAVRFLKKLHNLYGDWFLALASYNAGPGNVNKAIKKSGGYDFWSIKWALPLETQNYVPSFIAMVYMMHYAKDYHLYPGTPKVDFKNTTVLKISEKQSLKYIAELVGTSEEILKVYNPGLKKGIIPKNTDGYNLIMPRNLAHVLNDKKDLLAMDPYIYNPKYVSPANEQDAILAQQLFEEKKKTAQLEAELKTENEQVAAEEEMQVNPTLASILTPSNKPKTPEYQTIVKNHTVRKGENLTQIANQYNVSINDLKEWNPRIDVNSLWVGANLKIYKNIAVENQKQPESKQFVAINSQKVDIENERQIIHRIRRGETLLQLTRLYNVSLEDIRNWNNISGDELEIGQEIYIYQSTDNVAKSNLQNINTLQYFFHVARKGDTLQSASMLYNIPLETLKKMNNKNENEPLKPGEKIKIPSL